MRTGHLIGGIALGALVGVGVGYVLGMDAEKKNQLLSTLKEKIFKGKCNCGCESCDCDEKAGENVTN